MTCPDRLSARHREVLIDYLGIKVAPNALPDGSIALEHLGLRMILANHAPEDPEFVQLLCQVDVDPNLHHRDDLAFVAQAVTHDYKAVKAHPRVGSLLISAESIAAAPSHLPSADQLAMVLPRLLSAICVVVDDLGSRLAFQVLTRDLDESHTD